MKIKQELSNNAIEKLANNYKGFYEPMQDLIDNSVEAEASKIKIYIGISSKPSKRSIIIEDNGYGIEFKEATLKKVFGYGWTERTCSLNEHGFGFKTATAALGKLVNFSSFTKKSENGFKVLKMENNEVEPTEVKKSDLEKKPSYSGTRIKINGVRSSGNNGISLFENTEEDMQLNVSKFVMQIGKTFGIRINNGLKIHCEIENIDTDTVYFDGLIEGFFPAFEKGRHLIQRSISEESGLEYDIIAFEQTEDDIAFPLVTGMNQRYIYWKDRLIMIPSSADKDYGNPVKDIEYLGYREILIIKKAPGLVTKQTKDGFVVNEAFKSFISSKIQQLGYLKFRRHFTSKNKHCEPHEKMISELEETLLESGHGVIKNESIAVGMKTDLISRYKDGKKDVIHIHEVKAVAAKPEHVKQLLLYALAKKAEQPTSKIKATLVATSFTKKILSQINQLNSMKKVYKVEIDIKIMSI